MSDNLDISGLDKIDVLVALYNASKQQGLGLLNPTGRVPLPREEAVRLLQNYKYFDYLGGRVLKIDLSGDDLDTTLYDEDNGMGAAMRALAPLFAQQ